MVCKNCGADLKPGIKYCLECGNYIDENEYNEDATNVKMKGAQARQLRSVRRKRKTHLSTVDILVYAGLSLIIIVSLIIIIYTLFFTKTEEIVTEPPVVTGNVTVNIDNYEVVVPGSLNYDVQGSTMFVSDNKNYTFSYKNTTDRYETYSNDLNVLSNDLAENNYEVLSTGKQTVGAREFIICEIRVNGRVKYLYLTKLGNYTTMGVIDAFEGGDWSYALETISTINDSATLRNISSSYNDDTSYSSGSSSSTTYDETQQSSSGPVGPNGEQPGQLGPNGEQPPSGP